MQLSPYYSCARGAHVAALEGGGDFRKNIS